MTWALGSWVQGRLADQVDRYRLLVRGCLPIAAGLVVLVVSVAADWPGWTVLVVWAVVSLGVGLSYPTTSLLTLRLSPPAEVGRNSSSLQVSEALASAVALAGPIGFVGLVVPHLVRLVTGPDYRRILAGSAVLGPVLVLLTDTLGRIVAPPSEIQVGIMTAVLGAPALIWLVRRQGWAR